MVLGGGAGAAGAALLAACGAPATQGPDQSAQPKEVVWALHFAPEDTRAGIWAETWRRAEQATGVKITILSEGSDRWTKRQAEFAGGTTSADIMGNQTNWVIPGGIAGIFADHTPYVRRDRWDLGQFYKAAVDTWAWKGKLWAIPYQAGGEVVHYNKALFDAKGVKYPHKDWTYDEFLAACQRLTDPANNKWAVDVGQNGLHYMMGTFVLNFGGKLLNDARDKALYGDDAKAIQGAELDVDLHVRYKYTPPAEARASLSGKPPMQTGMVAMNIDTSVNAANLRPAIGAQNLDFAPPPKGPTGTQTAAVGGNSWSILGLSKAKDAAWQALKWIYSKEGIQGAWITVTSWPASIAAARSPLWLDQFSGTHMADCARVWETGGHDLLVLPEGNDAWTAMNTPLNKALAGEIATRDAMRQSAAALDELFSRRPAAWR
jgi:multiple sugar transport system substrate-binding protein